MNSSKTLRMVWLLVVAMLAIATIGCDRKLTAPDPNDNVDYDVDLVMAAPSHVVQAFNSGNTTGTYNIEEKNFGYDLSWYEDWYEDENGDYYLDAYWVRWIGVVDHNDCYSTKGYWRMFQPATTNLQVILNAMTARSRMRRTTGEQYVFEHIVPVYDRRCWSDPYGKLAPSATDDASEVNLDFAEKTKLTILQVDDNWVSQHGTPVNASEVDHSRATINPDLLTE